MRIYTPRALPLAIAAFLSLAPVCHSQMPGKVDLEAAETAAGLIDAPVFAIDGTEVGNVADVLFDDEGRPRRLRLNTAAHLGLGTRRVEIPQAAFTALRGKVVLELPAEAVQALPEYSDATDEKG